MEGKSRVGKKGFEGGPGPQIFWPRTVLGLHCRYRSISGTSSVAGARAAAKLLLQWRHIHRSNGGCNRRDRRTHEQTPKRYIDTAYYAGSVNKFFENRELYYILPVILEQSCKQSNLFGISAVGCCLCRRQVGGRGQCGRGCRVAYVNTLSSVDVEIVIINLFVVGASQPLV